jgi:hypothetical protein
LIAKGDYVDGRCSHVVKPFDKWNTERGYEAGYLAASLGRFTGSKVALVKKEFLGEREVIALKTTTGTFIAEGFASHNSEYGTQKPSCEYYLGLAKGRGIKIYVPKESDLCKSYFLYGKDEEHQTEIMVKLTERMNWLQNQLNGFMAQRGQVEQAIQQHIGAIEDVKFWMSQFKH